MSDSFKASVQYGDLKGTVAIDGHQSPPLDELAKYVKLKAGYSPVGFGLNRLHPNDDGKLPFTLYAVDTSQAGSSTDEMREYAKMNGALPVWGFRGEIDPVKFEAYFKRFSMRVQTKSLRLEPEQLEIEGYCSSEET